MENKKNEKAKELDLEQLEKVNGGHRDLERTYTCSECRATFHDFKAFTDHQKDHINDLQKQGATKRRNA